MPFTYSMTEARSGYRAKGLPINDAAAIAYFGIPAQLLDRDQALEIVNRWNETSEFMSGGKFWHYTLDA